MIEEFEKQCKNCYETKRITEFYRRSGRTDHMAVCKRCHYIKTRGWQKSHVEQVQEINRRAREKADRVFAFRVSVEEKEQIKRLAADKNISMSDYVRSLIYDWAKREGILATEAAS
jgi:hypothetical protein